MSYPRLVALIYLERLQVEEAGVAPDPYVLEADLMLPRPGVNDTSRTLMIDELPEDGRDWTDRSLRERLLFKEIVEGPVNLGVTITPAEKSVLGQATDLVGSLGSELLSTYVNFRYSTITDITDTIQEAGVADLELITKSTIAMGNRDLNPDEPETMEIEIPLVAPETIENPNPDPMPDRDTGFESTLKEAGDPNGSVTFRVEMTER